MSTEPKKLRLEISIRLSQVDAYNQTGYPGLELRENIELTAASFMEVCSILAKFDELAKSLQEKKP